MADEKREFAFYYPNAYFHDADWVKNLILFFDGLAVVIPEFMPDHSNLDDLAIMQGLREHGLFKIIRPEASVDKDATEKLASAMVDVLASGVLDSLEESGDFQSLSMSRLGFMGDHKLAQFIFDELKARKLARDSEDGVSIPMHPMARLLVLVLLSQILRQSGESGGIELSPATDRPHLVGALTEILSLPQAPSAGNVVSLDMRAVGTDLSSVGIDEILAFRKEHGELHRNYRLSVRRFVRELSLMGEEERSAAFESRQEEIDDIASEIRNLLRTSWKTPASFMLGIAGAAWTATTGDALGALLAGGGAVLGLSGSADADAGAYSFLFNAQSLYK